MSPFSSLFPSSSLLVVLSLISYSPSSSLISYSTSSLPHLSVPLLPAIPIWNKKFQSPNISEIGSGLQSHVHLLIHQWSAMMFGLSAASRFPPADPLIDWPSLWPQLDSASKRVKTRSTFQEMFVDWNVEPANQMFSVKIIIHSFTHSLTDLYF